MHTNSIESAWRLFKHSIIGAFHKVNAKHTDRFFAELEWHLSNRDDPRIVIDTLRRIVRTPHMTYRDLVGRAA